MLKWPRGKLSQTHTHKSQVFLNMYEGWWRYMPVKLTVSVYCGWFCVEYLCICAAFSTQQGRRRKEKGGRVSDWEQRYKKYSRGLLMDKLIVCLSKLSQDASIFLALFSHHCLMLRSAALLCTVHVCFQGRWGIGGTCEWQGKSRCVKDVERIKTKN